MSVDVIPAQPHRIYRGDIEQMHRLRHKVFVDRLGWVPGSSDGLERDWFDRFRPTYLLHRSDDGRVGGCLRLLPTTGPNMLRDIFPGLMDGETAPVSNDIWEMSRFSVDHEMADRRGNYLKRATSELFCGAIEYGLGQGLTEIVAVFDMRMDRVVKRAGCPPRYLGKPRMVGSVMAAAGAFEISPEALARARAASGLDHSTLHYQPMERAA